MAFGVPPIGTPKKTLTPEGPVLSRYLLSTSGMSLRNLPVPSHVESGAASSSCSGFHKSFAPGSMIGARHHAHLAFSRKCHRFGPLRLKWLAFLNTVRTDRFEEVLGLRARCPAFPLAA